MKLYRSERNDHMGWFYKGSELSMIIPPSQIPEYTDEEYFRKVWESQLGRFQTIQEFWEKSLFFWIKPSYVGASSHASEDKIGQSNCER
jgi:hypothetical protein